jgi:hypothetical protein
VETITEPLMAVVVHQPREAKLNAELSALDA